MLYIPLSNPYRRFIWKWWKHYLNPRSYWDTLVVWYQRATRGWAYCDTWSLDSYLCEVLVPALEHLKHTKHGVPCPDDAAFGADGYSTSDEEFARWQRVFDAELAAMIDGFKAASHVIDGPPHDVCDGAEGYTAWRRKQEAIRRRGFESFAKHFHSLWD